MANNINEPDRDYMDYKTRRKEDEENEIKLRPLADAIYLRNGFSFERCDTKDEQICGIDLYMKNPFNPNEILCVDEKAATKNKKGFCNSYDVLNTFCFETHTVKNYKNQGWLFASNSKTTHYMCIYPKSYDMFKNVPKLEMFLIEKQFVLDTLKEVGICSADDAMRLFLEKNYLDKNGNRVRKLDWKIKLMHVKKLEEKPLLALINRDYLRKNSILRIDYKNQLLCAELEKQQKLKQQKKIA